MIAFLGTGLLGSNFVKALVGKGETVRVWNRTAAKAKALEAEGDNAVGEDKGANISGKKGRMKAFADVAEAVKGAERIHLTLSDDDAVDETLEKASSGFMPGAVIIDHTTTSAEGVGPRKQRWKDRGVTYIHAPVFMGPPNALDGTGYMLVSGDQEMIKTLTPALSTMTGQLINLGPVVNRAAGMKLTGNLFLMALTAGLSDMLALAKSLDIPPAEIEALLAAWNPGAAVPARLKRILSGQFNNPSWELNMARKDARLMLQEAAHKGRSLTVIPAVAQEMDQWIEKGHGHDDWTIIAKDNL